MKNVIRMKIRRNIIDYLHRWKNSENRKFNLPYKIRFSMNNLKENEGLLICPIPLTDWLYKIVGLMKITK